jgi:RNA-splicing ligase RtcB
MPEIILNGKYAMAKIFTNNVESTAISQLMTLLNQPFVEGAKIRIMPDTHAGAGCVIGTTMTLTDKVVPNLVGVDIGCGMLAIKLKEKRIDLPAFDSVVRKYVPSGGDVHENENANRTSLVVEDLRCFGKQGARIRPDLAYKSVGTLGGGNHFIELDRDKDGNIWLVIHTGSGHLGIEGCNFYQNAGYQVLKDKINGGTRQEKRNALIAQLKAEGRHAEIDRACKTWEKNYQEKNPSVPYELAYVEGELFDDYIHDMDMVQKHAACNRSEIARLILKHAKLHEVERFETVHNYIDVENMILRKGAVSACEGERLLIPINMRDGSLICIGKGNPDWNSSAPHGAGRLMSRADAKESICMADFEEAMQGIYTTCVNKGTIDESPMAYKPIDEIIENIADTVDIVDIIKPIYNFKAGGE